MTGCGPRREGGPTRAAPVKVYVAGPTSIASSLTLTGGLGAKSDAVVYAKVTEKLTSVSVKPGDYVGKGQVLAAQYNGGLKAMVAQAEAGVRSARVQCETIDDDYERMKNLLERKAISRQQFDQTQSQYKMAHSQLDQAEAAVVQAKEQYRNSLVKAPFGGKVGSVKFRVGETVTMGQPVIHIVDTRSMRADLLVPESDIGLVRVGQRVSASFPSFPGKAFAGHVVFVDEVLDPRTHMLKIQVQMDNPDQVLKSGLFGRFSIVTQVHEDIVSVTESAVISNTVLKTEASGKQRKVQLHYVYVVQNGRAQRRDVSLGLRSNGLVELTEGVDFGDTIVVSGQNVIKSGSEVRIVEEEAA